MSDVVGRTLDFFSSPPAEPDLTLVMGRLPDGWVPSGVLSGDRFLYQAESQTTTVLSNRAVAEPSGADVEYVVVGDLTSPEGAVEVYVPNLRRGTGSGASFSRDFRARRFRRALIDLAGNPMGVRRSGRHAEAVTEAVLEPFLFYRLPSRGLTFVHGAGVCSNGRGTLLAGSANIGKTSFILGSVSQNLGFLGDTFTILSSDGKLLSYPGLLKLNEWHLAAFPELRGPLARGLGSIGSRLLKGELSANPKDALESLPQHKITELFERAEIAERCQLERVVIVTRGSFPQPSLRRSDPETTAKLLAAELYWEFELAPWRNAQFIFAPRTPSGNLGRGTLEHHRRVEEVISKGLANAECMCAELPFRSPISALMDLAKGTQAPTRAP